MNKNLSRRRATVFTAFTSHDLVDLAGALSASLFPMHLNAWREALQARAASEPGPVPDSYLVAMRKVVAQEAADNTMDFEDAIAAVAAIHELGTAHAHLIAAQLLGDLQDLGSEVAAVLAAALAVLDPTGTRMPGLDAAQGVEQLRALRITGSRADIRAQASLLLGDAIRTGQGIERDSDTAVGLYMAALEGGGKGVARAHFHLGTWHRNRSAGNPDRAHDRATAEMHFTKGTEAGCMRCTAALGLLHTQGRTAKPDAELGRELLEIAAVAGMWPQPDAPIESTRAEARESGAAPPTQRHRQRTEAPSTFFDRLRGLLRVAFPA